MKVEIFLVVDLVLTDMHLYDGDEYINIKEALSCPLSDKWKIAMEEKMNLIRQN